MIRKPVAPPFYAFTIKHPVVAKRIITELVVFPVFDPANPPDPLPVGYRTTALWDTGATASVITAKVVAELNLSPVGAARITHAGGFGDGSTYIINMGLPNRVIIPGVLVADCPIDADFEAIIGMDVISEGDFAITNVNGQSWMSYRYPSIQAIDYVLDANRITYAGVKRNEPCPCGKTNDAGKRVKFKDCHMSLVR